MDHKVLVVDDDPVIHDVMVAVFGEIYDLRHAVTVAEGRARLAEEQFVLAIVDKNLPDGTGLDLVATARAHSPNCELIMITAEGDLETAKQAIQLGFHDYVSKPFDVDILQSRAAAAVAKADLRIAHEHTIAKIREVVDSITADSFKVEVSVRSMVEFVPVIREQITAIEGRLSQVNDDAAHGTLMGVQELLTAVAGLEEQLRPIREIERHFEVVRKQIAELDLLARRKAES